MVTLAMHRPENTETFADSQNRKQAQEIHGPAC